MGIRKSSAFQCFHHSCNYIFCRVLCKFTNRLNLLGSTKCVQTLFSQTCFLVPGPPYFGLSLQFLHCLHSSALQPLHCGPHLRRFIPVCTVHKENYNSTLNVKMILVSVAVWFFFSISILNYLKTCIVHKWWNKLARQCWLADLTDTVICS